MTASDRPTKAQRLEDARVAAQLLREEQQHATKRYWIALLIGGVVFVAVVACVVVFILRQGNRSPLEEVALRPQGSTLSGAIPVGSDGVAGSAEGANKDAVVVSVYTDYMCPYCGMFETSNSTVLKDMREAGEIVVEYHPVAILDHLSTEGTYSTRAATAAALVADKAPDAFLAFNDALFVNQPDENAAGLTDAEIAEYARDAGASEEVAMMIDSGEYLGEYLGAESAGGAVPLKETLVPWVTAATEQASRDLEDFVTPTILLNGVVLDTEKYDWSEEGGLEQAVAAARG